MLNIVFVTICIYCYCLLVSFDAIKAHSLCERLFENVTNFRKQETY